MADIEKVIKGLEYCIKSEDCRGCIYWKEIGLHEGCPLNAEALELLKEQEAKQYNNHEVACILADLFGDPCACNFNDIDTWLPYKCDFRETCCPNPVGVACWEQYLKHKEGR